MQLLREQRELLARIPTVGGFAAGPAFRREYVTGHGQIYPQQRVEAALPIALTRRGFTSVDPRPVNLPPCPVHEIPFYLRNIFPLGAAWRGRNDAKKLDPSGGGENEEKDRKEE